MLGSGGELSPQKLDLEQEAVKLARGDVGVKAAIHGQSALVGGFLMPLPEANEFFVGQRCQPLGNRTSAAHRSNVALDRFAAR